MPVGYRKNVFSPLDLAVRTVHASTGNHPFTSVTRGDPTATHNATLRPLFLFWLSRLGFSGGGILCPCRGFFALRRRGYRWRNGTARTDSGQRLL